MKTSARLKFSPKKNGNNIASDSFNSTLPNLSSNGFYTASKTSTNGDIATLTGIINVGNANIYGAVLLGPTATDSIKNNGFVTGGTTNDFNATFPDVTLPQTTWLTPPLVSQLIGAITYNYVFQASGDYVINNLSGSIYVATNVVVRLRLTGTPAPRSSLWPAPGRAHGSRSTWMAPALT